jgi:hypothetical protein
MNFNQIIITINHLILKLMKNLFTFFLVALLSVSGLFAQEDSLFVAGWVQPVPSWWAQPAGTPVKAQATAVEVTSFDAVGCDFDTEWAKIAGSGNVIANVLGLAASNTGPNDFKDAAFKVFADASNMYILLQYTDDDVTGNETVEVAWAPYDSIEARRPIANAPGAWYSRFVEFGAYKATFKKTGFDAAMMVEGTTGAVNWGGTNDILAANLFIDDHTVAGSGVVKQIITIGYPALTGSARLDFNMDMWNTLNTGKGISFDMKVNDKDTDDALKADLSGTAPAEYWWNSTANDCYALITYAGNLNVERIALSGDAAYVAGWAAPIPSWWAKPSVDVPAKEQASAIPVASFDAVGCDFDAEWAKISVENVIDNQLGLTASHKGPDDFKNAGYKVYCDASNMYILLQYTDDDVTGDETVEVAWAPYLKIDAAADLAGLEGAWYTRYTEFGAYKATFKKTGFDAAMMVTGATGAVNWGGTNDILAANLFIDDHTAVGSSTVKQIITIGYAALTGDARPEFDQAIWNALNEGKGISFDLKVNDKDTDDALKADLSGTAPAEYWWNSTSNDCYALTWYAGFLNVANVTAVANNKPNISIFSIVTPDMIQFNKAANVDIYNSLGQQLVSRKNVMEISLSNLSNGVYIIRANNESRKFVR